MILSIHNVFFAWTLISNHCKHNNKSHFFFIRLKYLEAFWEEYKSPLQINLAYFMDTLYQAVTGREA